MTIVIEPCFGESEHFDASLSLLESQLQRSLHSELAQSENTSFLLLAKSSDNDFVGGLAAGTSYDWLLIKLLWVNNENRGCGIGRSLLSTAEKIGLEAGCHSAWLDTSNPIAEKFYRLNGYIEFGRLENESEHTPPTHKRWFLKKAL